MPRRTCLKVGGAGLLTGAAGEVRFPGQKAETGLPREKIVSKMGDGQIPEDQTHTRRGTASLGPVSSGGVKRIGVLGLPRGLP